VSYTQLGYDIELQTPLGRQKVSFDLDKVARDMAEAATREAWPRIEAKATEALPRFVDQAIVRARPSVRSERDIAIRQAGAAIDQRMKQAKLIATLTVISLAAVAFGSAWYLKKR
jgi:hypothetical protein